MNDSQKIDLGKAAAWLSSEIEIRVPKLWLVIGVIAIAALGIIALD